jgi:DNA-binding SARP family transcriptional activator
LLVIEGDWVRVNSEADCWFDVSEFEQSYQTAHGTAGRDLDGDRAAMLEKAVTLYRGELLEGCYDDWCLFERERLQNVYLIMLDKLMSYSEAVGDYEGGIDYGARILSCDRAREHAHRRLMRIYYLAGDRTAALRQYGRCAAALEEELAVKPSRRTSELFEQIRSDRLEGNVPPAASGQYQTASAAQISAALGRLRQVKTALVSFHRQIKQDIQALEVLVKEKRDS